MNARMQTPVQDEDGSIWEPVSRGQPVHNDCEVCVVDPRIRASRENSLHSTDLVEKAASGSCWRVVGGLVRFLVTAIGVLIVFAAGHWWFAAPRVLRIRTEVPQSVVRSEIPGSLDLTVQVGDWVARGQILGVVHLSHNEQENRRLELLRLKSVNETLKKVADVSRSRIESILAEQMARSQTERDVALARLAYDSQLHNVGKDMADQDRMAQALSQLSRNRVAQMQQLQQRGAASDAEITAEQIRDLQIRFMSQSVMQAVERTHALKQPRDTLNEAIGRQCDEQSTSEPALLVEEQRRLEDLEREIDCNTHALESLQWEPVEFAVQAACSGRVVRVSGSTFVNQGDEVAVVEDSSEARLVMECDYESWTQAKGERSNLRCRIARTGGLLSASVALVRRGLTERDRHLQRQELIEVVLAPDHPIHDLVDGERVELVR